MKKLLGIMVMALIGFLPFTVKAAGVGITYSCGNPDADGLITCTVGHNITSENGLSEMTITLTQKGGAQIEEIINATDSDWTASANSADNVWTVLLTSPGAVKGEGTLFKFTYKASGTEDCGIEIRREDEVQNVTPPADTPDEPTDNKNTGSTLPYIALGTIALVAVGAYFATRNKAKMYKI